MKNKNKLSRFYFMLASVFFPTVLTFWYNRFCFCKIDGLTTEASYNIFIALSIAMPALGILINLRNRRNFLSVFTNTVIASEIYSLLALSVAMPVFYKVVFYITIAISAIYILLVMVQKTKAKNKIHVFLKKARVALLGTRTIASICLLAILIPFCIMQSLDLGVISTNDNTSTSDVKVWTRKENADTLSKLEESQWKELSIEEKLDVMNVVKNIEMSDLGVKKDITLNFDKSGEGVCGSYLDESHTISINMDMLQNRRAVETVTTLLHECRHAYQHECAELYNSIDPEYKDILLMQTAADYKESLDNYISAVEDFEAYENQLAEADAREYSNKKIAVYYKYFEGSTEK